MLRTMDDMRRELCMKSRSVEVPDDVSVKLSFRLPKKDAKRLILRSKEREISESLFARQAIIEKLDRMDI